MTATDNNQVDNEALAGLFRLASRLMARANHRRDHAHHAQGRVLDILKERGPINQRELLEILDVRSSSLSEVIGKLERNGLVARERDENDRRSFVVSLTERADALLSRSGGDKESADSLFSCLDSEERTQLAGILEKIISSLKDDPELQDLEPRRGFKRHAFENGRGPGRGGKARDQGRPGRGRRSRRDND